MARYIDAEALLEQVIKKKSEVGQARYTDGFNDAILRVRSMISAAATADVVPRSEVLAVLEEFDWSAKYFKIPDGCAIISLDKLEELKKKYTE